MARDRYCLVSDDDGHDYVIPVATRDTFFRAMEDAYSNDKFDEFEEKFGSKRINGSHTLTFTDPKETN